MINLEVKGQLAKLLATEDLIVEHRNVDTAMFNVDTRVLTLPRWDKASNTVFDLLISHEVGHALFTPNEDWTSKVSCPKMFVNVTEDARIESLMKRRFGGLPKTFYNGYKELYNEDFFGIGDEDPSGMQIADRVNLHFKVGNFIKIPFTKEEQVVVDQIASAKTFKDALESAEALYALHKIEKEEKEKEVVAPISGDDGGGESDQEDTDGEEETIQTETDSGVEGGDNTDDEPGDSESNTEDTVDSSGGGDQSDIDDDIVKTMENVEDKLKDLTNPNLSGEPIYLTHPKINLDKVVISNETVHERIARHWNIRLSLLKTEDESKLKEVEYFIHRDYGRHEESFRKFRKDIQPEVNYMVKEFECKKSADAYSRATVSKTGVLDCTKLHTYRYNEDLFRKVTTLPEGKNHGLIFVLDWSGSMCEVLSNTVKQLLSLVMFCDKVGIPFDVYTFTNDYNKYDPYAPRELGEVNTFDLGGNFNMVNILTSKVNRKTLTKQMERIYMIAEMFTYGNYGCVPDCMCLSGTPLNEAILTLHSILPKFQSENNVQKTHTIILTDGEAGGSRCVKENNQEGGRGKYVSRFVGNHTYLRNRKTGVTRKIETFGVTKDLLEDLRETFPHSTFTGFRILEIGGSWFVRQAVGYDQQKLTEWKKNKSICLENQGYNKYFVIQSNKLKYDTEFDVDEGATKAKIKSSFAKSLKGKKNNKRILGDFIGMIA
ncbi:peptidase [Synechococcus phage ACG-2014f]|uniref:Peptidase n=1 Tax=Synechococcus phage ACG-2014f TaxID=1493511 RepID=A0A0E3I7H5_9CAUD|nr:peptidase [Synechococcus phage ACG-2014f]